jgi:hypothetical protein
VGKVEVLKNKVENKQNKALQYGGRFWILELILGSLQDKHLPKRYYSCHRIPCALRENRGEKRIEILHAILIFAMGMIMCVLMNRKAIFKNWL